MAGYQTQYDKKITGYNQYIVTTETTQLDTDIDGYIQSKYTGGTPTVPSTMTDFSKQYDILSTTNTDLQVLLQKMVSTIVNASPSLERYGEATHPEEYTKSRELLLGVLPTLRPSSIPYILSAAVFMALLSIFIIFQMMGVSGQLNLPPALVTWWVTPSASPFYKNPMVLGGVGILVLALLIVLGVGYYRTRNTTTTNTTTMLDKIKNTILGN